MYLTFPNQDTIEEDFLEQTRGRDIDLIVCSDAEAILGIGDQGVGVSGVNLLETLQRTIGLICRASVYASLEMFPVVFPYLNCGSQISSAKSSIYT